ncbi:MAG TPA: MBL fold metallo-hydrolase [Acidimicrobiia bacterium]|jgi:glyoxylase-like metal-dependent hydrolase (beta-lactamase superfamily II)
MTSPHHVNRRLAIKEMGKAGLAIVVFGAAACTDSSGSEPTSTGRTSVATTTPLSPAIATSDSTTITSPVPGVAFNRVDLGFVSAYILYRAGEAALVDTGVAGSADAIEESLIEVGLDWGSVGHVILTHKHPDHVGSIDDVLERASGTAVYAGAPDISEITAVVDPRPVGDGDSVFDLGIIETPGHTPGHISVHDSAAGVLVVGDALNGADGGVVGPDPGFSENMAVANDSLRKLAGLSYEVALFGHGEPVLAGASTAVAALAADLG